MSESCSGYLAVGFRFIISGVAAISPVAGHVTLLHSVCGSARIVVVADSKGIGAGQHSG